MKKKGYVDIPLIGLDGKRRSRKKEFEEAHGIKNPRPPSKQLPKCSVCVEEGMKPAKSVREDAYGRPLEECHRHAIKKTHQGLREMPPFRK